MIYGYARCSTDSIKQDYAYQVKILKENGCTNKTIYSEYETGTKQNRPELMKLLAAVTEGDTIVCTEVSRLTRSTKQLCDLIDLVQKQRLKLVVTSSITVDCTKGELDAMTKAFLQMTGVLAELEHDMICGRVKMGIANRRSQGKRIGRPTVTADQIPEKVRPNFIKYKEGHISKTDYAKICGISRPTLDKYIGLLAG